MVDKARVYFSAHEDDWKEFKVSDLIVYQGALILEMDNSKMTYAAGSWHSVYATSPDDD